MKKNLKLMAFALLAIGMMACGGGEKKITQKDLQATESALANDKGVLNMEMVPKAIEQYSAFAEQNPDDAVAPEWLFKAFQLADKTKDFGQAKELGDKLMKTYPKYEYIPVVMFMMARDVYDQGCHDLDMARAMYDRLVSEFPESKWASDAKVMRDQYLGLTDDEIMARIAMSQMEEVEGEF